MARKVRRSCLLNLYPQIIGVWIPDEEERILGEQKILKEMKLLKLCKSRYVVEFYGSFVQDNDISICSIFSLLLNLFHF